MKKRAQAAMEFLMTYGWALLVVLIAIAALAFFGVLSPGRFLPSNCNIGIGFACSDFKVNKLDLDIDIYVQNGIGSNLDTFAVYTDPSATQCDGRFAYIALPIISPPFYDGQQAPLKTFGVIIPGDNDIGIKCFDTSGFGFTNCCKDFGPYGCSPSATCDNSLTSPRGSKFKTDLVVVYKEQGSTLTHSRVGQIVTQIE